MSKPFYWPCRLEFHSIHTRSRHDNLRNDAFGKREGERRLRSDGLERRKSAAGEVAVPRFQPTSLRNHKGGKAFDFLPTAHCENGCARYRT